MMDYSVDSFAAWNGTTGTGLVGGLTMDGFTENFSLSLNVSESESGEMDTVIEMDNPEEMRNPSFINPFFLHIIITHTITFVVGLLGNIFVVTVMVGDRKSRNATNLFLVSLAVSDLLLLLLCVPLETLQYFMVQWNEDGSVCKVTKYVELLSAAANVLTLCAVSLERFIVIVFPMRSRSLCTITNCRRVIFIVWIIALLLSTPVIPAKSGYSVIYQNRSGDVSVKIFYCKEEKGGMALAIYKFVILFAAPAILMLICYTYVIRELWRSTRNINLLTNAKSIHGSPRCTGGESPGVPHPTHSPYAQHANNLNLPTPSSGSAGTRLLRPASAKRSGNELDVPQASNSSVRGAPSLSARQKILHHSRHNKGDDAKKARKQVIKMLILVVLLFLVCWGPKLIFPIGLEIASMLKLDYFTQELYFIRIIFHLIPFIHSCINPIIYSAMSKNFRRSTQRQVHRVCVFFGCRKCCNCGVAKRNNIPLRPTRTRSGLHGAGESSLYSNNYCQISEGPSTRHTEMECVSAI